MSFVNNLSNLNQIPNFKSILYLFKDKNKYKINGVLFIKNFN